jgi:hypothetical protein
VRAIRRQFFLPCLEVRVRAEAFEQLGRAVASGSAAAVALDAEHLQVPGNVSDGDDTAHRCRSVDALSRWIVLWPPASHDAMEAQQVARVESKARFGRLLLKYSLTNCYFTVAAGLNNEDL